MVWDDPSAGPPSFLTYSDLLKSAEEISRYLSASILSDAPVAIYGQNCPQVLAVILAVMFISSSLEGGVSRGVAYLPVDLNSIPKEQMMCMLRCGVELAVIEISLLQVGIERYI